MRARARGVPRRTSRDRRAVDAEHGGRRPSPACRRSVPDHVDALEHARVGAELLRRIRRAWPLLGRVEPADSRVALVVPQRGEHADECRERIGGGAAEHSRVHGALSVRTVTTTRAIPRRLAVRVGTPTATLPVSQTRIASARSRSGFSGTNFSSRRSCSSDPRTIFTVTGGSFPSARRAVRCAARLPLQSAAPPVPAAAALGQLPGRRLPAFGGRGLHVVVEVEETVGAPGTPWPVTVLLPSAVSWARTSWTPTPEKASTVHSAIRSLLGLAVGDRPERDRRRGPPMPAASGS